MSTLADAVQREIDQSLDRVMAAAPGDRLAAAHREIERQKQEIEGLTRSCAGYLDGRTEALKLLDDRRRYAEWLEQKKNRLENEAEGLSERLAIMQVEAAHVERFSAVVGPANNRTRIIVDVVAPAGNPE